MRPAFLHYLVQIWTADRHRLAQRDNPVRESDLLPANIPVPPSRLQIPAVVTRRPPRPTRRIC